MEAHEIVGQVHDAYSGITQRLAKITGKSEEYIRSHHRESKSRNPNSSGNCSPATHFLEYCHQYEAAAPGAGRMLANRIADSLEAEWRTDKDQTDIHDGVIAEHCDVSRWLNKFKIADASPNQLAAFERECAENMEALSDAMATARAARRKQEMKARNLRVAV